MQTLDKILTGSKYSDEQILIYKINLIHCVVISVILLLENGL